MCGRYTLINLAQLSDLFPWIVYAPEQFAPRYNIAPTQPILAVTNQHPDRYELLMWGLVPSWAKDPKIGSQMINARAETIAIKPAFRNALRRRRCLIPADGFYEWRREPDGKTRTPMYIRMASHRPFAFAGLWESWGDDKGNELTTCTILTTAANQLLAQIHDRMPVILPPEQYDRWLDDDEQPAEAFDGLFEPYPAQLMESYEVSRQVNSPANDLKSNIAPVANSTLFG